MNSKYVNYKNHNYEKVKSYGLLWNGGDQLWVFVSIDVWKNEDLIMNAASLNCWHYI
jgi:hypothetical protein